MNNEKNKENEEKLINVLLDKLKKTKSKKTKIKNEFINDLISLDEYHLFNEKIDYDITNIEERIKELKRCNENEKNDEFTYEQIEKIVPDIKLNWLYLDNKEKRQFLERFIESIDVEKDSKKELIIKSVIFKS